MIWASRCAGSRCRSSAPARACGVSSISRTPHPLRSRRWNVLQAPTTSLTTTRASSAYGCRRSQTLAGRRNRFKSPSRKLWRLLVPTASITRRACAAPPTTRPDTNSISARARSNGSRDERSKRNMDEAQLGEESSMSSPSPGESSKAVPASTASDAVDVQYVIDAVLTHDWPRLQALSALLNEKASLTSDMALRLEKAFGPKMEHLMRMQLAY